MNTVKAMGSHNGNGTGKATESKKANWYDVLSPFDPEMDLTGFIAAEAVKDCQGDYELLQRFLEWKDGTGAGDGQFNGVNVDILGDITASFMNVGFAVGYLIGRGLKTTDSDAAALLDELKEMVIKKGLIPLSSTR